jgi:hypothetical protein
MKEKSTTCHGKETPPTQENSAEMAAQNTN